MPNRTVVTCDGLYNGSSSWPEVAPNPDISGIGVLIGFMVTAYLTFFLVVVYYLAGYVEAKFTNEVDRRLLAPLVRFWFKRHDNSTRRSELMLRRAVLMFSDQQAVTGIALLASGYAQLSSGIESYHWQILVYLVWFSSLTHLTTLTILREYFRKNLVARRWRCFLMLATVIMLATAIVPTGDGWWFSALDQDTSAGVPALCFFRRIVSHDSHTRFDLGSAASGSMFISLFVLASGYLVRLVKFSERATQVSREWTRTKPGRLLKRMREYAVEHVKGSKTSFSKHFWTLGYVVVETVYILLRASSDAYDSLFWEVLWLFFALVWGSENLFLTRKYYSTNHIEDTWSFGQFIPIILLILPFLSMVETYYEKDSAADGHTDPESITSRAELQSSANILPKLIHIGHWNTSTSPPASSDATVLSNQLGMGPTGSEIETEGEHIFGNCSRASYHVPLADISNALLEIPTNGNSIREGTNSSMPSEYRQFEWYWILILMILSSISTVIIYTFARFGQIVNSFASILLALGVTLTLCFCYTSTFVILSMFHEVIEKTLEQRLRVRRRIQQIILRRLTWIWLPAALGPVFYVSLFPFFYY